MPGVSGNPAGRPKGSRNRLSESFFKALADEFDANGVEALKAARINNPGEFVRVVAGLQTKDSNVDVVVEVKAYTWQK